MGIIKKYQLVFLIALILVVAAGGSFIVKKINEVKLPVTQEKNQTPAVPIDLTAEVTAPVDNTSPTAEVLPEEEKVKLIINTGEVKYEFTVPFEKDSTVFSLLKKLSVENNFTLDYRESGLGVFIEEVYGIKNNGTENKYWLYKVNGQLANVGASSYRIKEGDEITWNYEEAKVF